MTETKLPGLLVTTQWLEDHLDQPGTAIVDMRGYVNATPVGGGQEIAEYTGALDEYQAGHIPGSVYIDWTRDIIDPDDPVPVQIAAPGRFRQAMESLGIGDDTDVVIVDHKGGHFATRLWWALRYYGHDRAAVLDGGFAKWEKEGRPITTAATTAVQGAQFTPGVRSELRIEADAILSAAANGAQIVDARDAPQFLGDVYRGSRAGHIPGAILAPAKSLVNADGTWKTTGELQEVLSLAGVDPERRVIAYCNGGVTATAVLFALAQLGQNNFANYDGSWNEWGERMDLPVETATSASPAPKHQ